MRRYTSLDEAFPLFMMKFACDVEIAAFLTALHIYGLSLGENEALSKAMVQTGKTTVKPLKCTSINGFVSLPPHLFSAHIGCY